MIIKKAEFVISNEDPSKCPKTEWPEFAFVGRSNVGKSSLINMLTGYKKLAKISTSPGKTRLINHFNINDEWFLVDLPGYGFAKALRAQREKWLLFIRKYLIHRENLQCVMVLIDARHEPQQLDLEFMTWLGVNEVPFAMVFTKADKLTRNHLAKNISHYKEEMLKSWEELPPLFVSSAETGAGRDDLLDFIENIMLKRKAT
jgi:GTP-binding protein